MQRISTIIFCLFLFNEIKTSSQSTIFLSHNYVMFWVVIFQAQMVAAAVQNLCEAANALVQGHGTEEKLISAARQVASSTAQLLVACKVKADADSVAMRRLQVSCLTWFSGIQWMIYVINHSVCFLHGESHIEGVLAF